MKLATLCGAFESFRCSRNSYQPCEDHYEEHIHSPTDVATDHDAMRDYQNWPIYWPGMDFLAAEKALADQPDGSYLIRDTSSEYTCSLSVKWNNCVRHFHIQRVKGVFSFVGTNSAESHSLQYFIAETIKCSLEGRLVVKRNSSRERRCEIKLLYPVHRRSTPNVYC